MASRGSVGDHGFHRIEQRLEVATQREPASMTRFGYALTECGTQKALINLRVAVRPGSRTGCRLAQ